MKYDKKQFKKLKNLLEELSTNVKVNKSDIILTDTLFTLSALEEIFTFVKENKLYMSIRVEKDFVKITIKESVYK